MKQDPQQTIQRKEESNTKQICFLMKPLEVISKILKICFSQYIALCKNLYNLYKAYGGLLSFLFSPFLHISIALSIFINKTIKYTYKMCWYDIIISCIPSIVGMSLTGYALILTFGSESFRKIIRGSNNPKKISPYLSMSSSFAYFVIIQIFTLVFAIFCRLANKNDIEYSYIGTALLIYSILVGVGATINAFLLSRAYDEFKEKNTEK